VEEVQRLLDALALRERTLVLLDVGTGLRMSELFGLKWKDVDFRTSEVSVIRSIVMQVTGPCKTEASQKPIPLDSYLAEALRVWQQHSRFKRPEDWIFASPRVNGRNPVNRRALSNYRAGRELELRKALAEHLLSALSTIESCPCVPRSPRP